MAVKTILIVEDEKPMAKALSLKFKHSGFQTVVAHDGQAALDVVHDQKIDLILLDLMMPTLDGFSFLERLQVIGKKIPILVSTNLSQPEDEARARELGAVDYFVKADTPIYEVVAHALRVIEKQK